MFSRFRIFQVGQRSGGTWINSSELCEDVEPCSRTDADFKTLIIKVRCLETTLHKPHAKMQETKTKVSKSSTQLKRAVKSNDTYLCGPFHIQVGLLLKGHNFIAAVMSHSAPISIHSAVDFLET